MNLITVLLLCIAVECSIGQPLTSHRVKRAGEAEQIASMDRQGMELISEINKLMVNHYSDEISSLMKAESSLIPAMAKLLQQSLEEKSPVSGPEKVPSESASCTGSDCGKSQLPADNAMKSPSSTSNGISVADMIDFFQKMTSASTAPKMLKVDLGKSIKEYLRRLDESCLELQYKMVDVLEALANAFRKSFKQISK